MRTHKHQSDAARQLFGPTVASPDGRTTRGKPLDLERILTRFEHADAESRRALLCRLAQDLTVAIRSTVADPPLSDQDIERLKRLNEGLHQLTSCANPHRSWSAADQALVIRSIIQDAFEHGFDWAVGAAFSAVADDSARAGKPVAAK